MRPYRLPPPFLKLHPSRPRAVPTSNQSAVHTCATGPECLISKLLKALHRLAREQIERVPSLSIELNELTAAFCRLLGLCTFCRHQVVISPSCLRGPISSSVTSKENSTCVECTKCVRKGRYSVRGLIEKYGSKANMMKWKEQLNGDCPKRDAHGLHERCDLICPDLPKVLLKNSSA
jgi:hypothetical protein